MMNPLLETGHQPALLGGAGQPLELVAERFQFSQHGIKAGERHVVQGGGAGDVTELALGGELGPRPKDMTEIGVVVLILVGTMLMIRQKDVEAVRGVGFFGVVMIGP